MIIYKTLLAAALAAGALAANAAVPVVSTVEENSGIRSDRRPIPVGYYDEGANTTFISWMGADSHPKVKAFDHAAGKWSLTLTPGVSPFVDKHNYPALLRGKDGRLVMFYGCHNSTLRMAVSPKPGSIEGEWTDRYIDVAERASYPAPVLTEDGTYYVFFRDTRKTSGHADDRPYRFVKSTDGGRTWTNQLCIDPYPRSTDNMTEVYNGQVSYQPGTDGKPGRVHLAWTVCGEKLGRHAHATYGRNVYYAYLNLADDHMYNIQGVDLGPMIDNVEADRYCLALETPIPVKGHQAGLQISVHYRDNGSPIIHYAHQDSRIGRLATWTGSEWHHTPIETRSEPRGIEKLGPETFRIYSTMSPGLVTFVTTDGGMTVSKEAEVTTPESLSRCYVIDNARPEMKLMLISNHTGSEKDALSRGSRHVYVMNDIFNSK